MSNPTMCGMMGGMSGFGFGGKHLQPMFDNFSFGGGGNSFGGQNALQPYTGLNLL